MESWLLQNFSTFVLGLGIVTLVTAASLAGLTLVRRSVTLSTLESHHDVAGFILAVVGVVYAVLLAFVVIIVWQQFEDAKASVDDEAVAIGSLYRDAVALGPRTVPLRVALTRYSHSVVDDEWPTMAKHHDENATTDADLNRVWEALRAVPAKGRQPTAFYNQASDQLHALTDLRRKRILKSGSQLPSPLWIVLIAGAIISIGFTYFFGVANFRAQALMVAALASIIGLVLFLVLSLDLPFTGDVGANPRPIEDVIHEFPHYTQ
jgi:Protein of unknown function (DUF4239)